MGGPLLLSAALLAAPALAPAAQAQSPAGFYVSAGIGVNQPQSTRVEPGGTLENTLRGSGDIRFEPQAMGLLALGYGFGNGIRVELEGSLRANAVESAGSYPGLTPVNRSQGQLWNWGLMANALVDVDLGASWIRPYAGVGLGYVWSELRDFAAAGTRQRLTVDDTSGALAYQAILGAAFPIDLVPGLSATAEYRFLGTLDIEHDANLFTNGRRQPTTGSAEVSPYHHAVLFGLRYSLGREEAPPPLAPIQALAPLQPLPAPPPIAAAPAPVTRSFIVYFGLNSAGLTTRAREIVTEAAIAARSGTTRIDVSGHTDRSGTPAANRRLSQRRAQAVASELRRQGIAASDITITALGETQPAIPTRNGVREPRNRRVEIVVR
ncbi:OmpA family protein [Falsiroseomonas selenitidurans]|uniref:OmpA family protein n=1 Tax=Falsiroseomonas selenitidurans TaxID=2716335 RepID=UPI001F30BDEF|nr:OmpA family protein [Falsiroseomonas selenitidurans]